MNGTHPQPVGMAAFKSILLLIAAASTGCQTHPTAVTNPYASPDRVPPPSTRALLPGQATPYYQGDPLPTLQSVQPPQNEGVTLASARVPVPNEEMSSDAEDTSAVRIPSDDAPLRAAPPTQSSLASPVPPASSSQTVSLASFDQSAGNQTAPLGESADAVDPSLGRVTSPAPQPMWRSPRVNQPSPPSTAGFVTTASWPQYTPGLVAPALYPGNPGVPAQGMSGGPGMDVRLRAVPSPPPANSAPRIRFPSDASSSSTQFSAGQATPYANYTSQSPGAQPQTLAITPIQEVAYNTGPLSQGALASADGFRPRGSTR